MEKPSTRLEAVRVELLSASRLNLKACQAELINGSSVPSGRRDIL